MVSGAPRALDPPPLRGAAAVVRDRGDVGDRGHVEAGGLEAADRRLASGARTLDEDLDAAKTVLHRPPGGRLGGHLGGERGALARALEPLAARRPPGDHVALGVGEADDGVVEGRQDVRVTDRDVLALTAPRPDDLLLLTHRGSA